MSSVTSPSPSEPASPNATTQEFTQVIAPGASAPSTASEEHKSTQDSFDNDTAALPTVDRRASLTGSLNPTPVLNPPRPPYWRPVNANTGGGPWRSQARAAMPQPPPTLPKTDA